MELQKKLFRVKLENTKLRWSMKEMLCEMLGLFRIARLMVLRREKQEVMQKQIV